MKTTNYNLLTVVALAGLVAFSPLTHTAEKRAEKAERKEKEKTNEQDNRKNGQQERTKRIAEELKLTSDQREKLKPILQEETKQIRALRQDTSVSRPDRREKLAAIREDTAAKVKPILSAEQFEKWKKLQSNPPDRKRRN